MHLERCEQTADESKKLMIVVLASLRAYTRNGSLYYTPCVTKITCVIGGTCVHRMLFFWLHLSLFIRE